MGGEIENLRREKSNTSNEIPEKTKRGRNQKGKQKKKKKTSTKETDRWTHVQGRFKEAPPKNAGGKNLEHGKWGRIATSCSKWRCANAHVLEGENIPPGKGKGIPQKQNRVRKEGETEPDLGKKQ